MTTVPHRTVRLAISAALVAFAAMFVACIELDGQRIAWFHDEARDELRILLLYDGIHDSKAGESGGLFSLGMRPQAAKQVREFVEHGNVMLLDWMGSLDRAKLRKGLEGSSAASMSEAERRVTESLLSMPVEVLGWYGELDGHIGAAQRVTLPRVSELLTNVNLLISEEFVAEGLQSDWPRSSERWLEAARSDHTWLALEGQSLQIHFPVHPDEWVRMKRVGLLSLADDLLDSKRFPSGSDELGGFVRRLAHTLSGVTLSLQDQGDQVTLTFGRDDGAFLTRVLLRDEYEPSMESVVREAVQTSFDDVLAQRVLAGPGTPSGSETSGLNRPVGALDDVLSWGPPEERVRALLDVARPADGGAAGGRAAAAWLALDVFAQTWNADGHLPTAPLRKQGAPQVMPRNVRTAWQAWYAECRGLPAVLR